MQLKFGVNRRTVTRGGARESLSNLPLLGLTLRSWIFLTAWATVFALCSTLWYAEAALWVGIGVFVVAVVFGHLCLVADRCVAFPGLIAFSACIQWIVGPMLAYHFPPSHPLYELVLPLDVYLSYGVPATAALWFGLHLPTQGILRARVEPRAVAPLSSKARRTLDWLICGGLFLAAAGSRVPEEVGFLAYILASLRFFGALGWMVTQTRGWKWRVALVFSHLALQTSAEGIFYELVHWGGFFVVVYAFRRRWRWAMGVALIAALLAMGLLQDVKSDYRSSVWSDEVPSALGRFIKLGTLTWERVSGAKDADWRDSIGDVLVRFNQGWVIARVIDLVPRTVPHANGETLRDAAIYSIVPRALVSSKPTGESRELFARYAGIRLNEWTSVGLTIAGELYANFGFWGGVAGTFGYGLLIGGLFVWLVGFERRSVLWWGVIPVVLLVAIEPAWNIQEIANHIVKAGLVVIALVWFSSNMRHLLGLARNR